MRFRRAAIVVLLGIGMLVLMSACSAAGRLRLLRFFFDGVPQPGEKVVPGYPVDAGPLFTGAAQERPARRDYYAHTPFRRNQCGSCHNAEDGQLFRTIRDGLCSSCHEALTANRTYIHGPAAANACDFCHHPHTATHPGVLLDEPQALCLACHQLVDLTAGQHHQPNDERPCHQCHDPHGGSDRFFLRPAEP